MRANTMVAAATAAGVAVTSTIAGLFPASAQSVAAPLTRAQCDSVIQATQDVFRAIGTNGMRPEIFDRWINWLEGGCNGTLSLEVNRFEEAKFVTIQVETTSSRVPQRVDLRGRLILKRSLAALSPAG